jgi:hypothetical protein
VEGRRSPMVKATTKVKLAAHIVGQLLKDTVLQFPGILSGFYCSMPDLAIFYVGYGLPHRVLILGLSPYTIYLQVAINIVDCQ